jgi:hypothetical protein
VHGRKVSFSWKSVFTIGSGSRNGNLTQRVSVCGDKRVLVFWEL